MPSKYLLLQRKVKAYISDYRQINGRSPSIPEISIEMQQSNYDILKVLSMQSSAIYLNTNIGSNANKDGGKVDGKERTVEDLLPSVYNHPLQNSDSKDLRREMESMMQVNLNDVERDVLRLRLGLDDGRAKAVKEVGKRFKISWKQVRTVEKEALSKLSSCQEIDKFSDAYHSVPS
jgi:DNA-directed RNA polymerase sigma subunit (sigma70/sigma32)